MVNTTGWVRAVGLPSRGASWAAAGRGTIWLLTCLVSTSMAEVEGDSENITDAIKQENSNSISKIRSLFVDLGFPAAPSEDAGRAGPSEKLKDGEA